MGNVILRARQLKPSAYLLAAAFVILLILPLIGTKIVVFLSTEALIYAILALGLNLLIGYTGLISFGQAAFFAVGGYAMATLLVHTGIHSFWLVMLTALAATAIFSMVMGIVLVRVRGFFFVMLTLAVAQMVWGIVKGWTSFTGGSGGLYGFIPTNLGLPWAASGRNAFYYLVLVICIVCIFLMYRIVNSPFGRALVGIREDEVRMQTLGYKTWLYKYCCIIISGTFGGLAGALKVYQDTAITPSYSGFILSASALLIVLLGGKRLFMGPIVGAFILIFLKYYVSIYTLHWSAVLGALFIIAVVFIPEGIVIWIKVIMEQATRRWKGRYRVHDAN